MLKAFAFLLLLIFPIFYYYSPPHFYYYQFSPTIINFPQKEGVNDFLLVKTLYILSLC